MACSKGIPERWQGCSCGDRLPTVGTEDMVLHAQGASAMVLHAQDAVAMVLRAQNVVAMVLQ